MDETVTVTIRLLDKEYRIGCPSHERDALLASAQYVNGKMREIRDRGRVLGTERVAILAALNIAHELLQNEGQIERQRREVKAQTETLLTRIEKTLAEL